jgi:hypothetical protein
MGLLYVMYKYKSRKAAHNTITVIVIDDKDTVNHVRNLVSTHAGTASPPASTLNGCLYYPFDCN